jgi:prepilin-type N-terminal cleavage/methylation domain-containing protein
MNIQTAKRNNAGFTLLELLVVLFAAGLLGALGFSYYGQFSKVAKEAEAKTVLASAYAAEQTFAMSSGSFTDCLAQIGYAPMSLTNYYEVGFALDLTALCGSTHTEMCAQYRWRPEDSKMPAGNPKNLCINTPAHPKLFPSPFQNVAFDASAAASGKPATTSNGRPFYCPSPAGSPGGNPGNSNDQCKVSDWAHFKLGATGQISASNPTLYDSWQIDETKTLTHLISGI